ncbi:MAG: toll/interleukin-1 receptor domain-containing protein [Acidobacteriia bacterium]|nr:toll/interleukin-1 receptor domain-containing protein [Terriglobia bacterium]
MKVFISWSGNLSHKIALILKDWLPNVVPSIDDAWVSSESISKGSQWSHETTKALAESDYGIICLVPENLHEPWLNFEAGAIFRAFHSSRVSPFLFGLVPKQVEGPLALFQATEYSKDDIRKLIHSINKVGLNAIASRELNDLFDQHWPRLEQSLDLLKQSDLPAAGGRVRYLKGRKDIYANAHQLLGLAEQRVRVLQFFVGQDLQKVTLRKQQKFFVQSVTAALT